MAIWLASLARRAAAKSGWSSDPDDDAGNDLCHGNHVWWAPRTGMGPRRARGPPARPPAVLPDRKRGWCAPRPSGMTVAEPFRDRPRPDRERNGVKGGR